MLKKLSTKFILIFTGILTAVFAVMVFIVQVSAMNNVENYIQYNIRSAQADIDSGITEVIDEVAYFYARMVKSENEALLDTVSTGATVNMRRNAFVELVTTAKMNSYYFVDVGWRNAGTGDFFTVNGYASPSDHIFSTAEDEPNKLILGEYKDGCDILAIEMSNDITVTEGCFVFYLMESTISSICNSLNSEAEYMYIMRSDGYIFSHDYADMLGKVIVHEYIFTLDREDGYDLVTLNGQKFMIVPGEMSTLNANYGFDCYLISMLSYDHFYGNFNRLTLIMIILAASVLAVGTVLAIFRAKSITRPVEKLNNVINEVISTGDMSKKTANKGDEIYQLEKNYDKMMDHIFSLMQKNKEDMEAQRKLELDSLQMQINPHFLYNTLDAVVWMAKIKGEPEIASLAINLAKFFRLSLHKGDKFIAVWEEIELVEHYLEIDKIRFPNKVTAKFEVNGKIKNYKVLKLLLQPVVENALKYAFPDRASGGLLIIRATGQDDDLIFEVEDNGIGFDVRQDILEIKNSEKSPGSGYGLYNVNERIRLEYGENYGINIVSNKGQGTKVTIRIAKRI